jgi:ABC-type uncharacterized transport system auxiliary subunit
MKKFAALMMVTSAMALSGCISLLPEPPPPPALFVLEAGEVQRLPGDTIAEVVSVAPPQGQRAILGADLIWRTGDSMAYVSQSQWTGRAQERLQTLLVQTLARQGRVRAAVESGDAQSNYEVRWDVTSFEVVENGRQMSAQFAADVRVLRMTSREVLATTRVAAEAPVSSRSATEASQALARAAREGSARIGVFVVETLEAQASAVEVQPSAASINR